MQLEKLCSNRPSKKDNEEDVHKLSCVDHLRKCDVEAYLKNINEEVDDPSSRYLLTTPKQQRDVSANGSDEEGDKLEQVAGEIFFFFFTSIVLFIPLVIS